MRCSEGYYGRWLQYRCYYSYDYREEGRSHCLIMLWVLEWLELVLVAKVMEDEVVSTLLWGECNPP